jgi:peptide/nickel transport system substrate-binding protein
MTKSRFISGKFSLAAAAIVSLLWAAPALAGKGDDTLRWASDSEPSSLDWYQHTLREGIVLGHHIWDTLLYKDPATGDYVPHLASSLEFIDDTTVEVKLKKGITFHNGEAFDADDVVYTINWVTNPKNAIVATNRVFFIKSAEKIDQYTARIKFKDPFPAALEYFATAIMVYPNEYYEKVGPEGMASQPIGTGPYRVTEVTPGNRIVLKKNENYFGGAIGQPQIGTIEFRRIAELNTAVAELVTGGLDWIWRVPPDAAKQMKGQRGITVASGETMRIGYISMDAAGRSGKTPFQDLRVRQAMNYAIDREAIRKSLIAGDSRIIHVPCHPTQFGCSDDKAPKYEYDPKKAKQLLAEAGYPNGFTTDFYAYRERPVAEAIIGYLQEVGINAKLQYLQQGTLSEMRRKGKIPVMFGAWGSSSLGDVTASTGNFFIHTEDDYARDDEVLRLMEAGNTTDQKARKEAYEQALALIAKQAYWAPLFSYALFYAYTDKLNFTPAVDEIPRFYNASWKD